MRVYPEKLQADLEKRIAPLYVVSGDEPLLVQETTDRIRAHLRDNGFTEREVFHAEGRGFDWDPLLFSVGSMSLFGDRKLLDVRLPTGKPGDKGGKALTSLVGQLSADTVMLLTTPRLDGSTTRTKWYKALDGAGVVVQIWPLERKDFPGWLNSRLRASGLQADQDAVEFLAERLEGNLLAAVQEIERLRLTQGDGHVDAETVLGSVSDSSRFDVFRLIDAALEGDVARSLRVVRGLRQEGAEILALTGMLAREVRSLAAMSIERSNGASPASLMKKYRVFPKRQGIMTRALGRHTAESAQALAERLYHIDSRVKGLAVGDPWTELEGLVVELGGLDLGLAEPVPVIRRDV